jgi:hypothetical protein
VLKREIEGGMGREREIEIEKWGNERERGVSEKER